MTDKELLEFAAKAAGLEVVTPTMLKYGQWNPLTDDGDALRLAVKLRIDIGFEFDRIDVAFEFESGGFEIVTEYLYDNPPTDKLAATRRAITRAAAEIGKAMKS